MLVGTKIAKKDILGTCVVVASVIWIVVFGGMNNGEDRKLQPIIVCIVSLVTNLYFNVLPYS